VCTDIEEGVCGPDRSALNAARDLERQVICIFAPPHSKAQHADSADSSTSASFNYAMPSLQQRGMTCADSGMCA
jgi:hypothetical protein